nr:MAG TPA: hypothetical protein [Caudoviricetes sp.]
MGSPTLMHGLKKKPNKRLTLSSKKSVKKKWRNKKHEKKSTDLH